MANRGANQQRIQPSTSLATYIEPYCLIPEVIKIAGSASPVLRITRTRNQTPIRIIRWISVVFSIASLLALIAIALSRFLPAGSRSLPIVGVNLLSIASRQGPLARSNPCVVGYDTFSELSSEIAHQISTLSERELEAVPALGRRS